MKQTFFFLLLFPLAAFARPRNFHSAYSLGGPLVSTRRMEPVQQPHGSAWAKGRDESLSETWDAIIADAKNSVDGAFIRCFAMDSDNLYIGGDFRSFDSVPIADFIVHYDRKTGHWNGMDAGLDNDVYAMAIHNGKLYVGGSFQSAGSSQTLVNHIAVWNGSSWEAIGDGVDGTVNAMAFIGDSLVIGGDFTTAGTSTAYYLALWDGFSWSELGGGTSYPVESLFATGDSLFVGGSFDWVGSENNPGTVANGIAMLHNGSWTTYGNGFDGSVYTMTLFDGKLWAGGDFFWSRDQTQLYYGLVSWDSTGWQAYGHDSTVGMSSSGSINELLPIGDSLFALGEYSSIAGINASGIAVYHAGSWSPVAGGLYGSAYAGIVFDSELWIGGQFTKAGNARIDQVATLKNNAWMPVLPPNSFFDGWEADRVATIVTNDRYVFIGGAFSTIGGKLANHLAVWDKQTRTWSTLDSGVDGNVYALALQGDKLIVGGAFGHAGTLPAKHIAEYDIATGSWSAMGSGSRRDVGAIAADANDIYASVYFQVANGEWDNYLGDWNGTSWTPDGGAFTGYANAMALQDSSLYLAGSIATADGGAVNNIAQLTGGYWNALNGGVDDQIWALAVVGQDLYAGGDFINADGIYSPGVAVWDGNEWDSVGSGVFGSVYALTAAARGGLYVGGNFVDNSFAVSDLGLWDGTTFQDVDGGVDNSVNALATDTSALYLGGWMESVGRNGTPSYHFAALRGAGADVSSSPNQAPLSLSESPDPVSAGGTVSINLGESSSIRLELLNSVGDRLLLLANGFYGSGPQQIPIDASKLPSGIYFLRLTCNGVVTAQHFIVSH